MGTRLAPWVLVVALPLLCMCGGGGGGGGGDDPGPPGPEAVLDGTYFITSYTLSYPLDGVAIGPPDLPCCGWGTAVADGQGGLTWTARRNVDHDLDPDAATSDLTYVVPAPRTLQVLLPVGPELPYVAGHVAGDGRFATLAKIIAEDAPAMMLLLRRGGTYSDASLTGSYILCGFACQADPSGVYGAIDITAPGSGSGSAGANVAGTPTAMAPVAMTYSTASNGAVQMALGPYSQLEGGIVAGGDVVVVGGSAADGQPPGLFAFVQSSTGRTLEDFQGDYGIVGYRYDVSADAFLSATGTLTADGAGSYTTTLTVTDGSTLWEDVPGGGTFDVSGAGVLLLTNTLGDVYTGGLSPDGAVAIASGAGNAGHDPAFFFLHR